MSIANEDHDGGRGERSHAGPPHRCPECAERVDELEERIQELETLVAGAAAVLSEANA